MIQTKWKMWELCQKKISSHLHTHTPRNNHDKTRLHMQCFSPTISSHLHINLMISHTNNNNYTDFMDWFYRQHNTFLLLLKAFRLTQTFSNHWKYWFLPVLSTGSSVPILSSSTALDILISTETETERDRLKTLLALALKAFLSIYAAYIINRIHHEES